MKSDTYKTIALLIICTALIAVLHSSNVKNREHTRQQNSITEQLSLKALAVCYESKSVSTKECHRQAKEYEELGLQREDLIAQSQMSLATWIALGIGIIGSGLIFWTLIATRDAATSANKTLAIAKRGAIVQFRPTITISYNDFVVNKHIPAAGQPRKITTFLNFKFKNWGVTPVNNFRVEGTICYEVADKRSVESPPNLGGKIPFPHKPTFTIAPNEESPHRIEIISPYTFDTPDIAPIDFAVTIEGTVMFTDVFSREFGKDRSFKIFYSGWPIINRDEAIIKSKGEDLSEIYYENPEKA